jgi:hypothetical protein
MELELEAALAEMARRDAADREARLARPAAARTSAEVTWAIVQADWRRGNHA